MKCLITGGAGFIGSHLAERLVATGDDVIAYDDLSTGSLANLAGLRDHPRFHFVRGDILDTATLDAVMRGCDEVYHLAAVVGMRLVLEEPVRGVQVNMTGADIALRLAASHGCRFLLASSSEVYGVRTGRLLNEDAPRTYGATSTFRWAYAGAKSLAESLVLARAARDAMPAVAVRLFNVAGPRQRAHYGMVIPRFVHQALAGEPITVFGTGEQRRCFGHVEEVAAAMPRLLRSPRAHGTVVNVGSDMPITIGALARLVRDIAGSSSPIEAVPYDVAYPAGFEEVMERVPDLSRLTDLLGERRVRPIEEIIRDIIAHEQGEMKSAA